MTLPLDTVKHLESRLAESTTSMLAATNHQAIALPDGMQIHDLEKYKKNRFSYRIKFDTVSLRDFCDYATHQTIDDTSVCFIDRERMNARIVFDLGTPDKPGHCKHQAALDLPTTPEYQGLLRNTETTLTQKEMAEFLEDYDDCITPFKTVGQTEEAAPMLLAEAINAVRLLTVSEKSTGESEVQNFSVNRTLAESIDMSSKGSTLPAMIGFSVTPYIGLEQVTFRFRVRVKGTKGQTPGFILCPIRKFEVMDLIERDFYRRIEGEIGGIMSVYMGSVTL